MVRNSHSLGSTDFCFIFESVQIFPMLSLWFYWVFPSELTRCVKMERFQVQTSREGWPSLGTQPRFDALSDLRVEIWINTVWVRLFPPIWPKADPGAAKEQLRKTNEMASGYKVRIRRLKSVIQNILSRVSFLLLFWKKKWF